MEEYPIFMDREVSIVIFAQIDLQIQLTQIKITVNYFVHMDELILKMKNTVLKEKSKVGEGTPLNFKTYCTPTVIKTMCYW